MVSKEEGRESRSVKKKVGKGVSKKEGRERWSVKKKVQKGGQ